jgi:ribokinase
MFGPDCKTLLVVGSVNVDLGFRVGRLPAAGETVNDASFSRSGGGKGANAAVAAARLGAAVALVAGVGDDEFGDIAREELADEGVMLDDLTTFAGRPTGVASVIVAADGGNQIAVASGANAALGADDVDLAFSRHRGELGAVLVSFEAPQPAVARAVALATAAAVPVVVNPAPARRSLFDLRPGRFIVTPNLLEAKMLTGSSDGSSAARRLAAAFDAPAIVTVGGDGVLLATPGRPPRRIAPPSVDVVDTTGAGDTFNGTLAAAVARGDDIDAATRFAVVAAALSVSRRGARGGMPSAAQVEARSAG